MKTSRLIALAGALLPLATSGFFIPSPAPPTATEFVNDITGHYVLIVDPAEKAAVASGVAGPRMARPPDMRSKWARQAPSCAKATFAASTHRARTRTSTPRWRRNARTCATARPGGYSRNSTSRRCPRPMAAVS